MNVKPFRIRSKWYFIIDRRMQGPFDDKARAEALYEVGKEIDRVAKALAAVNKRKKH